MGDSLWHIKTNRTWPPRGYPKPPVSYTLLEALRTCRLKAAFRSSSKKIYPRKLSVAARLGLAFHNTMEGLKHPASSVSHNSVTAFAEHALALFRQHLAAQKEKSLQQSRERLETWPEARVVRMENAVITAARSMFAEVYPAPQAERRVVKNRLPSSLVEHRMVSSDGLIEGIADRIDYRRGLYRITDYKTTQTPTEEDVCHHIQQIKLYAYLWFDTTGQWATEGLVSYPIAVREHTFEIHPEECLSLAEEVRIEARALTADAPSIKDLANPGVVCSRCDFRPWCEPFWKMQNSLIDASDLFERSSVGFEGLVHRVNASAEVTLLEVAALGRIIELRVQFKDFPHVGSASAGDMIRVLDAGLLGTSSRPTCQINDRTEIFILKP